MSTNPVRLHHQILEDFRNAVTYTSLQFKTWPFPGGQAGKILLDQGWAYTPVPGKIVATGAYTLKATLTPLVTAPDGRFLPVDCVEYLKAVRLARRESLRQRLHALGDRYFAVS